MASGGVITVSEGSILAADAVLPDSASGRAANNGASASHRRVGQNSWSAVKAMESIFSKPIIASLRYLVDAELERAMNRGEDTPSVLGLEGDDRMSRAVLVRILREVHRLTAARRRARSAATSVQARRKRPSATRSSTWLSPLVASACPSVASR